MKTKISLLILLFTLSISSVSAQFSFVTTDIKEARKIADSIALNSPRAFSLERTFNSPEDAKELSFIYVSKELKKDYNKELIKMYEEIGLMKNFKAENVRMSIDFDVIKKDDGSITYKFSEVKNCTFEDLFPFWKRFIRGDADAKQIIDNRRAKAQISNLYFGLVETGGNWGIYMGIEQ